MNSLKVLRFVYNNIVIITLLFLSLSYCFNKWIEKLNKPSRTRKTVIMFVFLITLILVIITGAIFSYFCEPDPQMVAITKQIQKEQEKWERQHK